MAQAPKNKIASGDVRCVLFSVEVTLNHDLEAEKREKGAWLDELDEELQSIPGVETELELDRWPAMLTRWDARVQHTPEEVQRRFREGNPSIETRLIDGVFSVTTWCLDPEHVPIVRRRLGEVLGSGA